MTTIAYPFGSSAVKFTSLHSNPPPRPSLRSGILAIRTASKIHKLGSGLSLRISHEQSSTLKAVVRAKAVSCCVNDGLEISLDSESSSSSENSSQSGAVTFDLKLPRRRLLVQFTCNACGERTQRLINRLAYEKGTVFVQCAGCLQHHKLVDNLGLIVEYDLREEAGLGENLIPPIQSC